MREMRLQASRNAKPLRWRVVQLERQYPGGNVEQIVVEPGR
jgi:hypothetical protein